MRCQRCKEEYPEEKLTYCGSVGGFFPSGFYCQDCLNKVRAEENQLDDEDIYDLED